MRDDSPHLRAPEVKATVYWGYADNDQGMTPENIATLNAAMDDAGISYTTEVYAGAAHGYTMADQGAYNEAAAERHFDALFALLAARSEHREAAGAPCSGKPQPSGGSLRAVSESAEDSRPSSRSCSAARAGRLVSSGSARIAASSAVSAS